MYRSESALARLGLRSGEAIRFKRNGRGRYIIGKVEGIEVDGSVALRDPDGSARSLRAERVEIRRPGPHGRLRWQIVSDVAITWEQLELFEAAPESVGKPGPRVRIRRDRPTVFDEEQRAGITPDAMGASHAFGEPGPDDLPGDADLGGDHR